mgnify:CR=1 FL=1
MNTIIISDLHFGFKNNSISWFDNQNIFFEKQFIPYLQTLEKENTTLVVTGDIFDNRQIIHQLIRYKVEKLFIEFAKHVKKIYIVSGNHDIYTSDSNEICSLDKFQFLANNIEVFIDSNVTIDKEYGYCFLPWCSTPEIFKSKVLDIKTHIKNGEKIKHIFCHAQMPTCVNNKMIPDISEDDIEAIPNVIFWAGHVHTTSIKVGRKYNQPGAPYGMTFSDANQDRGFTHISDEKIIFLPNKYSWCFYRFKDDEIFNKQFQDIQSDFIELYLTRSFSGDSTKMYNLEHYIKNCKNLSIVYEPIFDDIQQDNEVATATKQENVSSDYATDVVVQSGVSSYIDIIVKRAPAEIASIVELIVEKYKVNTIK